LGIWVREASFIVYQCLYEWCGVWCSESRRRFNPDSISNHRWRWLGGGDSYDCATVWKRTDQTRSYGL